MSQPKLILVAPLGEPGKRVRLAKTIGLLKDNYNYDITFWGWRRNPEETLGDSLGNKLSFKQALVKGGGYRSKWARVLYLYWMVRVFWSALFSKQTQYFCLGLETAMPIWFASRIRRSIRYIFDDADRLVLIWSLPVPVKKLIVYFEKKVSRDALTHIIPSQGRYDYDTDSQYEITNSPNAAQVIQANELPMPDYPKKDLHVYVNGWLDPTRGLDLLTEAAEYLWKHGHHNIQFNVAVGNLTDNSTRFFDQKNVHYLGSLTHVESLSQYRANDIVATFYDPRIRINQYAIPNKWGDAIAMGTAILVNDGVKTAEFLREGKACISVNFFEGEALAKRLLELAEDPTILEAVAGVIKGMAPNFKPFNEMMLPVLKKLPN